jgi:hypothetical protein
MSIAFWWIPNILAAVGLAVCITQGVRRHSLGLLLFALYFAYNLTTSIIVAVRQHEQDAEYVRQFVQKQIGPHTWTAPVLYSNVNPGVAASRFPAYCIISDCSGSSLIAGFA